MNKLNELVGEGVFESAVGQDVFDNYANLVYNTFLEHHNIHFENIENEYYADDVFFGTIYDLSATNLVIPSITITKALEELYDFFTDEENFK